MKLSDKRKRYWWYHWRVEAALQKDIESLNQSGLLGLKPWFIVRAYTIKALLQTIEQHVEHEDQTELGFSYFELGNRNLIVYFVSPVNRWPWYNWHFNRLCFQNTEFIIILTQLNNSTQGFLQYIFIYSRSISYIRIHSKLWVIGRA